MTRDAVKYWVLWQAMKRVFMYSSQITSPVAETCCNGSAGDRKKSSALCVAFQTVLCVHVCMRALCETVHVHKLCPLWQCDIIKLFLAHRLALVIADSGGFVMQETQV